MHLLDDLQFLKSKVSEDELVKLICDLVSIPSYPGIPGQETAVAGYIHEYFSKAGIESRLVPVTDGRSNVYAHMKGRGTGRTLLYNGHMDTVPPYDMQNATSPVVSGRTIKGRGTCDMKGSLACMMTAMKIINESGIKLDGDILFTAVIDEELTSEGTRAFIRSGMTADAAIVGEPMGWNIGIGHKGLQWFQFDIHGKAVHGGEQELGINAIRNASLLINRIEKELVPAIESRRHPVIGVSSLNYGYINGGFQPSTVAGECILQIDRRWIPGEKYDCIVREFEDLIGGMVKDTKDFNCDFKVVDRSEMEEGIIHEGFETDPAHPVVVAAENAVLNYAGIHPEKVPFKAWSDGGLLSTYGKIPTIIAGPGDLSCAHTSWEYLDIDQAMAFVMIFISTSVDFCRQERGT